MPHVFPDNFFIYIFSAMGIVWLVYYLITRKVGFDEAQRAANKYLNGKAIPFYVYCGEQNISKDKL